MKNKRGRKGFTLTEILVVVLVVAVLAAVAYPLYTKSVTNARAVEAVNLMEVVKNKQIERYARSGDYYDSFKGMGQLTTNPAKETPSDATVQIKDYTLSLNTAQNCITTSYEKRGTKFSFSSSYEEPGLGCEGDICEAFGDVIGATKEVCNCGQNKCPGGFQNPETCECGECTPGMSEACGNCGTRVCNSAYRWGNCEGSGACNPGSKDYNACAYGGYRECGASCGWGSCKNVGVCTPGAVQTCGTCGTQTCGNNYRWGACSEKQKPSDESQACGNCGTQTRTFSCQKSGSAANWVAGSWGTCSGQGVCAPNTTSAEGCAYGGKKTCTASCQWGSCGGAGVCNPGDKQTCGTCGTQTCAGNNQWGACSEVAKPADTTAACGNCGKQTITHSCTKTGTSAVWTPSTGVCTRQGECAAGTSDGAACDGGAPGQKKRTCNSACKWGAWDTSNCGCPSGQCLNSRTKKCEGPPSTSSTQYDGRCYYTCNKWTCTATGWACLDADKNFACTSGQVDIKACTGATTGTQKRTCGQNCRWGAWDASGCKSCHVYGKYTYLQISPSEVSRLDTCNGTLKGFTCSDSTRGKRCVDYVQTGNCGGGYTYTGTFDYYETHTTSSAYPNEGTHIDNLGPTIRNAIKGGNHDPSYLCKMWCASKSGTPPGVAACDAGTLKWHYNNFGNPCSRQPNGQYKCRIYRLRCNAATGGGCQAGYRSVSCC